MTDKSQPTSSRSNVKFTSATQSRKITSTVTTNGKTRPMIKTAAIGGKHLLPSKLKPIITTTNEVPVKPRVIPLVSSRKCEISRQKHDLYDLYLLNFMQTGFMRDMENLQEDDHLESGMTKVIDMISCTNEMVKVFADKIVLKIWDDLKQLDIIAAAFENIVDFTGEETLAEIQTLLMKKYEKITVTEAVMKEPIFHGVELEQLVDRVRTHLTGKIEEDKVIGFIKIFSEALSKIRASSKNTENMIEKLQQENKIVMEHCSLTICNKGWESYHTKKATEEEVEPQNEEIKEEEEVTLADED